LEKRLNDEVPNRLENMKLTNWSYVNPWLGSAILKVHLRAMKELNELKKSRIWNWDYVINLSESDFPIK
jgi:hypothetical protein